MDYSGARDLIFINSLKLINNQQAEQHETYKSQHSTNSRCSMMMKLSIAIHYFVQIYKSIIINVEECKWESRDFSIDAHIVLLGHHNTLALFSYLQDVTGIEQAMCKRTLMFTNMVWLQSLIDGAGDAGLSCGGTVNYRLFHPLSSIWSSSRDSRSASYFLVTASRYPVTEHRMHGTRPNSEESVIADDDNSSLMYIMICSRKGIAIFPWNIYEGS